MLAVDSFLWRVLGRVTSWCILIASPPHFILHIELGHFLLNVGQLGFCIVSELHRIATRRVSHVMYLFSVGLCCLTFPGETQATVY